MTPQRVACAATFAPQKPGWLRLDIVHPSQPKGDIMLQPTKDVLSGDEMFETMLFYSRRCDVCRAEPWQPRTAWRCMKELVRANAVVRRAGGR